MTKALVALALLIAMPLSAVAQVPPDMKQIMAACMAVEAKKPDSTRQGVSAAEFCAAVAVIEAGE